ncbi:MAG: putative glutamine amidotransferase [Solirubrobacteraceae bacterium]|nr:putative glutamine amidotransferase [Solirubrobacteraceae bacterium]
MGAGGWGAPPLIGVSTSEVRVAASARPLSEGDPPQHELVLGIVYAAAIRRAGAIPVVLPPIEPVDVPALIGRLQGICLSGGPDLDPAAYRARAHAELGPTEPELDAFELELARCADAAGLPILGICRGCQVLNVARGGTLHQHLPDVTGGEVVHRQTAAVRVPTHPVNVARSALLGDIVGARAIDVNSFHHQAADRLGAGLVATAWSEDGVVEAMEDPSAPFYLGVQWHAEGLIDRPEQAALFAAFVTAAREPARQAA